MKIELEHLADLIREELTERGWSDVRFAYEMQTDTPAQSLLEWQLFDAVREPNILLDDTQIRAFSTALGVSEQFLRNYHEAWRATAETERRFPDGTEIEASRSQIERAK